MTEEPPLPAGMTVRPYGWGDPLLTGAWSAFIQWIVTEDEMLDAFQKRTGHDFRALARRSPIEQSIDKATGREKELVAAFLDWATLNHWGPEDGSTVELNPAI